MLIFTKTSNLRGCSSGVGHGTIDITPGSRGSGHWWRGSTMWPGGVPFWLRKNSMSTCFGRFLGERWGRWQIFKLQVCWDLFVFLFWRYTVSWMYFWWPVMFNPDCTIYIQHEIHHQLVASPRYLRALNGPCYKQDLFGPEPSNIYNRFSGGPIVLSLESGVFHRKWVKKSILLASRKQSTSEKNHPK